ncbi:unnamed protein product, partial [Cladocopium goreaui]
PSPKVYHYRTKLTPHPQEPPPRRQRLAWQGGEASVDYSAIGFLEQDWGDARDASGRRWRKVVDVRSCPIATEALNEALPAERTKAKSGRLSGPLLLRDTTEDGVVTDPQQVVTEVLSELGAFSFRAGGFFQNNSSILPAFVQHVLSAAVQDSPEVLVDLYCGVGLFSLSGANHFQRIFGVEVEPVAVNLARAALDCHRMSYLSKIESVHSARGCTWCIFIPKKCSICFVLRHTVLWIHVGFMVEIVQKIDPVPEKSTDFPGRNAAAHGHGHVQFLAADAANGLREVARSLRSEKVVVVVDPPRQGLKEEARRALLTLRPQRMVYVSCDCATQARDLKDFVAEGYVVKRATPFDLFPQTRHLEVVVELELLEHRQKVCLWNLLLCHLMRSQ